ncbi:ABC transporter ATP-binding protein [Candidatus Saccharibacteria bacterium]|nr:ABC transporter ATP-binding protein [Candidatus Saccharibacteria bacterium]
MSENILEVKDLVKNYDSYRAVDNISFSIKKGQVLGLLGPNGAGKSTTIQILVGVTLPTSGKISYFRKDFFKHPQESLQRINFASAYNTLQGRITVKENLLVFAGLYQVKDPMNRISELLEYFEIRRLADHKYWDLSAGERTRVNLVKAMLNNPELILMDEPTASLDPDIADKTLSLIEELRRDRNISILFTSHNMSEVARICDEVIFLDKGRIVSKDTPQNHTKKLKEVEVKIKHKNNKIEVEEILKKEGLDFEIRPKNMAVIKTSNEKIAELIAKLNDKKIVIIDLEIRKPSLEDVFLEIARNKK